MLLTTLLLCVPTPADPPLPSLYALRVGRAETIAQGTIEHAVVLIEAGKIVTVGQDLEVERGIPVIELPGATLLPGLVDCFSRLGLDSEGNSGFEPQAKASVELYPDQPTWAEILEHGVTTLGLYPAGSGIPGQGFVVKPHGVTREAMVLRDPSYLLVHMRSDPGSKKFLRDGLEKADEYDEKEKKNVEKWDKDQEKKGAKKDEKKEEKKEQAKSFDPAPPQDKAKKERKGYVPSEPDEKARPFVELRQEKLRGLFTLTKAADYLHLLDVMGEETFEFDVRVFLRDDLDFHHVMDKFGEKKLRVAMEPRITLQPNTRRERNYAMELAAVGGKPVFVPRTDSTNGLKDWLRHVGEVVGAGLDRQVALRAVTLEPAHLLGLGERLGSLEPGKDANFVLYDGDPFEVSTRILAVILEGELVHGEIDQ
jgi:Amidohydrolase family